MKQREMTYPDRLTEEIWKRNETLLTEHRAWRATELKSEAIGIAEALSIYYKYGYGEEEK